jgi:hypothetical protein
MTPLAHSPAPPAPPYIENFCAYTSPVWLRALGKMCQCQHPNHAATGGCTNETHMHDRCGPCQAGD